MKQSTKDSIKIFSRVTISLLAIIYAWCYHLGVINPPNELNIILFIATGIISFIFGYMPVMERIEQLDDLQTEDKENKLSSFTNKYGIILITNFLIYLLITLAIPISLKGEKLIFIIFYCILAVIGAYQQEGRERRRERRREQKEKKREEEKKKKLLTKNSF